ncbi:MAG TPA: restriction endonuclease [Lacipirellulaceae bacterium]|nr:restriction endonuclease [Lacipirellulaceae bacterium]
MASRSERREAARMEAGIKSAVFGVVALAFLIGGVSGFAGAVTALVFLAVVVAVAGLAAFLILKSRLVARKKAGLLLIIAALLTAWFWSGARAPRQWPEERATVASINGPTAVTETDYSYRPDEAKKGTSMVVTQTKSWAKLSEARGYRPGPTAVYFNRANPSEVRFEPTNGWVRASASPGSTRIRVTGEGTATLRIGSSLFPKTATTTGPHVASYTVGATLPVWINPVSQTELSFQPRATEGGQKYWMAALAGALAIGGMSALVIGKQWIDPSIPHPASVRFAGAGVGGRTAPSTSIADQLRAIDWFQFEAVAARILESDGWSVQKSGGANPDGGADLLAIRNGRKAVIQCKHWRRIEVQPKIIRELIGTRTSAQFAADDAILFTLSDCTDAALACARENNVVIFNSGSIEAAIERLGIERFPELTNPDDKRCPKCGAVMVLRDKVETPFWGCSTYPRCRGTIERA